MRLIDANVILRFILSDNEEMYRKSVQIISEGAFTLPEVIAEVVYVLTKPYGIDRNGVCDSLITVLRFVHVDSKPALLEAISIYRGSSLDFVDCILIGRNHVLGDDVFSFDKKLNKRLV